MPKLPFNHSPRLAARFARLHRIKRKHSPPTKASLRQAGIEAAATTEPIIIPTGKRSRSPARD